MPSLGATWSEPPSVSALVYGQDTVLGSRRLKKIVQVANKDPSVTATEAPAPVLGSRRLGAIYKCLSESQPANAAGGGGTEGCTQAPGAVPPESLDVGGAARGEAAGEDDLVASQAGIGDVGSAAVVRSQEEEGGLDGLARGDLIP